MVKMFYWLLGIFLVVSLVITVATENIAVPLVLGVIFVLALTVINGLSQDSHSDYRNKKQKCCPHCGSPVTIKGNRWECGWCGDHGDLSSL